MAFGDPTFEERLAALEAFEKRQLALRDLPLAALQRKLEQDWQPNAGVLLGENSISEDMLASSDLGVWRTLTSKFGGASSSVAAGTYYFQLTNGGFLASGANYSGGGQGVLPLRASDFAVAGDKTAKLRVAGVTFTNGTAPANTYTHGLYPVTHGGGAGVAALTLGTVVAGSTVAVASPAANAEVPFYGTEFALPADGPYILGVVVSGAGAANSIRSASVHLQMRHV